jgi:hypothetical protein
MIRDRLASSEHREHTWKISMNRYGYVRKEMDTISGVRAYMVKMYLQVEMYTIFDDFTRINESGIKKLHVSSLLLYNNVCINFVTYKFCYRINNVCINFLPYKFCYV